MIPTHYHSSSKGSVPIRDMHDEHLVNAIAKLTRAGGITARATVAALQAEQKRRAT